MRVRFAEFEKTTNLRTKFYELRLEADPGLVYGRVYAIYGPEGKAGRRIEKTKDAIPLHLAMRVFDKEARRRVEQRGYTLLREYLHPGIDLQDAPKAPRQTGVNINTAIQSLLESEDVPERLHIGF